MSEGTVDELLIEMRNLRRAVGQPTFEDIENHAHKRRLGALPRQTLSPILRGERSPQWKTLELFVRTCQVISEANKLALPVESFDLRRWSTLAERSADPDRKNPLRKDAESTRQRPIVQMNNCTGIMDGDNAIMNIVVTYND